MSTAARVKPLFRSATAARAMLLSVMSAEFAGCDLDDKIALAREKQRLNRQIGQLKTLCKATEQRRSGYVSGSLSVGALKSCMDKAGAAAAAAAPARRPARPTAHALPPRPEP